MTIFGVAWDALGLEHIKTFLDQADDESLQWEAKGTALDKNEVRRQVCAFANSHDGGYLILGADRRESGWELNGVSFQSEPQPWITDVLLDPERGVRPQPGVEIRTWPVRSDHVAVIHVRPAANPPCLANGTVYERLPGKSQVVRDPQRLATLYAQGDAARTRASKAAFRAVEHVSDALYDDPLDESKDVRIAVGVATVGCAPDVTRRLFRTEFADRLSTLLSGGSDPLSGDADPVAWAQHSLFAKVEKGFPFPSTTVARVGVDGAVGVGYRLAADDIAVESITTDEVARRWRISDELVREAGGYGDAYLCVSITGVFPRGTGERPIVMRRGPMALGVDDERIASMDREMKRALGHPVPEPAEASED